MVSGGTRAVLLIGVALGLTIAGGLVGAAIDFVSGNQGWWGVCALAGLMAAGVADATIAERNSRPARWV
jgi:hypothetical protein